VLVEEVEAMLPASYADEPLGSDGKANPERQDIIVSGPQFAALVKLPQSPSEIAVTRTVPTILSRSNQASRSRSRRNCSGKS
jgi:hypothetical protein